jgi:hypothetical protein
MRAFNPCEVSQGQQHNTDEGLADSGHVSSHDASKSLKGNTTYIAKPTDITIGYAEFPSGMGKNNLKTEARYTLKVTEANIKYYILRH